MRINMDRINGEVQEDLDEVSEWCDRIYCENFGSHFVDARELFKRLQSKEHPITDTELQWILLDLPMDLFDVSEVLNRFRLNIEVIKVGIKHKETEVDADDKRRSSKVSILTLENKLLLSAYATIITRVENEISFCKELIMGAKKIWDGRRRSEESAPTAPIEDNLPEYKHTYVKGV